MKPLGAKLEAGVVTSVTGGRATVKIAGTSVPNVPLIHPVSVGDRVWLLRQGQTIVAHPSNGGSGGWVSGGPVAVDVLVADKVTLHSVTVPSLAAGDVVSFDIHLLGNYSSSLTRYFDIALGSLVINGGVTANSSSNLHPISFQGVFVVQDSTRTWLSGYTTLNPGSPSTESLPGDAISPYRFWADSEADLTGDQTFEFRMYSSSISGTADVEYAMNIQKA